MSIEAMKQAEKLLVSYQDYTENYRIANECGVTITALRQAIDQAELAKPVAYMSVYEKDSAFNKFRFIESDFYPTPVYTAPPRKEWVGLTEDEVSKVYCDWLEYIKINNDDNLRIFVLQIEAKLRERNERI